jgi:hypothetical protein
VPIRADVFLEIKACSKEWTLVSLDGMIVTGLRIEGGSSMWEKRNVSVEFTTASVGG